MNGVFRLLIAIGGVIHSFLYDDSFLTVNVENGNPNKPL
jgi:hypothetical protein